MQRLNWLIGETFIVEGNRNGRNLRPGIQKTGTLVTGDFDISSTSGSYKSFWYSPGCRLHFRTIDRKLTLGGTNLVLLSPWVSHTRNWS